MENRFATLKLLDEDSNSRSTKIFNYTEFLASNQAYARRSCLFENQPKLVSQYSCEQIVYNDYNARGLDVPTVPYTDANSYDQIKCQSPESNTDFPKSSTWQFSRNSCILQAPKFVPNTVSNDMQYDQIENMKDETESKSSFGSLVSNIDQADGSEKFLCKSFMKIEPDDNVTKEIDTRKVAEKKTYEEIKQKFRPLVMEKKYFMKKKANACHCTCITLCIIPIVTVILSLFINLNTYLVCNRATMFSNANLELRQKIYGQQNAVSSIITHLDQDFFYLKVLCLIGGTGVGKSYSVDIIKKNFPLKSKILLYDIALDHPLDSKSLNSLDYYDLFIIENLKMKHLDTFANMIDAISKLHKCLTVIAIFNVADVSSRLKRSVDLEKSTDVIRSVMASKKLDFLIVPYEPLNDESLEMCIMQAASTSGLKPTRGQINEIKQALISSGAGCKGAYAKLQVIGRS